MTAKAIRIELTHEREQVSVRWNSPLRGLLDPIAVLAMVLLVFAVCLGGASRQHELRLALVQLTALPLLALALPRVLAAPDRSERSRGLFILGAVSALPLLQLVPLPPAVWTALPNRQDLVLALELSGLPQGWLPLSLTPDRTWRSFLALLPPAAMYLAVLVMAPDQRLRLVQLLLALAAAAVVLAVAQTVSGGEQLYPWRTTSAGAVVGFFANRNHMATLCLVALPFVAAFGARAIRHRSGSTGLHMWVAALAIGILVVMIGVIRSRTGIVLVGPVLVASFLAAWIGAGRGRPHIFLLGGAAAAAVAVAAVGFLALAPILERFDRLSSPEGRLENWPFVYDAADSYLPLGSGLGSFDAVFRSVEPLSKLDPTYFNQAHNDYLETWLETGLIGAALVALFLVWFFRRGWSAWRGAVSTTADLGRAATVGIAVILVHSAVDYPLRTATIATVFALFCGLLEVSSSAAGAENRQRRRRRVES